MILHSGSIQGKYTDQFPSFRYKKPIPSSPSIETTHLCVYPDREYPHWNMRPSPADIRYVDLVDYEIRLEGCKASFWVIPGAFTQAKEPIRLREVTVSCEFLGQVDLEEFFLRDLNTQRIDW